MHSFNKSQDILKKLEDGFLMLLDFLKEEVGKDPSIKKQFCESYFVEKVLFHSNVIRNPNRAAGFL